MNELEQIISKLDGGSVDLEEHVELFKRGTALARECEKMLKAAQDQIDEATRIPKSDSKAFPKVTEEDVAAEAVVDEEIPF